MSHGLLSPGSHIPGYGASVKPGAYHQEQINVFAHANGTTVYELDISSRDILSNWEKLETQLISLGRKAERPLRGFVDVSACSRFFAVGAAAFGLRHPLASVMTLFYSEGIYPERPPNREEDIAFTGGEWTTVAIPHCEGQFYPSKKRSYLVSVGFEGNKTLRVLAKADPDSVSLLFPDPGAQPGYAKRAMRDNQRIIETYRIPDTRILRADAADAIAAWEALEHRDIEIPLEDNVFYLCCGTKPHAVALGLRSLTREDSTVLYVLPDQYHAIDIKPSGIFWRYQLTDISQAVHE